MTHELKNKLLIIAQYDGWELVGEPEFNPPFKCLRKYQNGFMKYISYISPQGTEYNDWAKELNYNTSLDCLHPVAMKVLAELNDIITEQGAFLWKSVRNAYCDSPINGEYRHLFFEVHSAIAFLNKRKATLVHETAEKMAAISYTHFGTASQTLQDHWTMTMYPAAELAVAMKANGFSDGYLCMMQSEDMKWNEKNQYKKQTLEFLGLTKPTDNETIS